MKSKVAVETLRAQLHSSLDTFSRYSSTEDVLIEYTLQENEDITVTVDGKTFKAYGLLILASQTIDGETKDRRLWLRQYPIVGSLNDIRYQAFKELYDVMVGNFLINAARTDDKTLEELSNKKHEEVPA